MGDFNIKERTTRVCGPYITYKIGSGKDNQCI